jgi:hypothetical protein
MSAERTCRSTSCVNLCATVTVQTGQQQLECHRATHLVRCADDGRVETAYADAGVFEQLHDAFRRARPQHGLAERQTADVVRVESIDVLVRKNPFQDVCAVDLRRKRQLNEQAVDGWIGVQLVDVAHEFSVPRIGGQMSDVRLEADLGAIPLLCANVDLGGSVVADEDDGESGPPESLRDARGDL